MQVQFLGDISLNGRYIKMYQEGHNPFITLEEKLSEADFVVGNLESFAKGDNGENHLKRPRLTTTVGTLNYLKSINLDVACLANNHVYDHLESGFNKTAQFLDQNEIQHLGAADSEDDASAHVIIEKGNVKIGVLNYVTHDTNPNIPDEAKITPNFFSKQKAKRDIENLKNEVDHVVLSLHWGGRVEGGLFPDYDQPAIARDLIDAGADLIVGHHSHTVQPYEIYKGKYIFYSLGNYCFSDYWFEEKYRPLPKRRRLTLVLNIHFTKNDYTPKLKFYRNKIHYYEELKKWNHSYSIQNWMYMNFIKFKPIWYIYYFNLKNILPIYHFMMLSDLKFREKVYRVFSSITKKIGFDK